MVFQMANKEGGQGLEQVYKGIASGTNVSPEVGQSGANSPLQVENEKCNLRKARCLQP